MSTLKKSLAIAAAAGSLSLAAHAANTELQTSHLQVSPDITLRRIVIANPESKGTVLLLHGFPETVQTWRGIAQQLGKDFEVHAFNWPGYGESSRPPINKFSYAPRDYAQVLKAYIAAAGIDRTKLLIYATDIGGLPALLLALEEPDVAARIIVGDFAPLDRPQYMSDRLRSLKDPASAEATRAAINQNYGEIIENTFHRGLQNTALFPVSEEFKADMRAGWNSSGISTGDAFYHYYSHFTRDQHYLEANLARLGAPVSVVWGGQDIYIDKKMGEEFAARSGKRLTVLPNLGHYPHLQDPQSTISAIRAAFD